MTAPDSEAGIRRELVVALRGLDARGLNRGSTGNLSHRVDGGMLITPTGMGAADIDADDLVRVDAGGGVHGRWQPSSEWHFHQALYQGRAELNAVVHVHSANATALACLRRELPAFHYMVAVAGGDSVRCAPYRLFGTEALSHVVLQAMHDRRACLLANHGLVAAGATLAEAVKIAVEVESLCESYLKALAVGEPVRLSASEMADVIRRFGRYGQRSASVTDTGSGGGG